MMLESGLVFSSPGLVSAGLVLTLLEIVDAGALTIWSGGAPAQLCDVVYPEIIFSTPAYTHTGLAHVCNIFTIMLRSRH